MSLHNADNVEIDAVINILLELFGDDEPCNFGYNDEYMLEKASEWCEEHCGRPETTEADCWRAFIVHKLNDIRKGKQESGDG